MNSFEVLEENQILIWKIIIYQISFCILLSLQRISIILVSTLFIPPTYLDARSNLKLIKFRHLKEAGKNKTKLIKGLQSSIK